ncbi:hypothetical protein EXS61_00605 [Candidatus Parcubacteria bacterium]|nr:hypothetical protein [Candidatus Parcubacteria bacterium]
MSKSSEDHLARLYQLNLELVNLCEEARRSIENYGGLKDWTPELLEKRTVIKAKIEVHRIAYAISDEINRKLSDEALANFKLERQ